ncbi:ATP-binding protein [Streptomyces prasinopilosus]|uniref:Histidine kinase-like ATPase domain-containing protein n=1 Tax=Streptomyces prasinopilosus TaxID=67344 RepID=A0A1G6IZP2_9ACTN|nr:ATP-binding protein [Streptomyces prasinopilosus]SDC11525.1 Histidine kinase-like ATPase domain-containing protein [Streptomyces prasinopilosus]
MKHEIRDQSQVPHRAPPPGSFRQRFGSTRRGARLARLLAAHQLTAWGWARGGACLEAAELVVGELAANAATHGHLPGRDFLLTMTLVARPEDRSGILRIEVADCRGERLPAPGAEPCPLGEQGRGLLLVSALASGWGVTPRPPSGKTVWAELPAPPGQTFGDTAPPGADPR